MDSALSFGCFARLLISNLKSQSMTQPELLHLLVWSIDPDYRFSKNKNVNPQKYDPSSTINNIIKGRKPFTPITDIDDVNFDDAVIAIKSIAGCFDKDGIARIISSLFRIINEDSSIPFEHTYSFTHFFKKDWYSFVKEDVLCFDTFCACVLLYTACTNINPKKVLPFLSSFSDEEFMKFQEESKSEYAGTLDEKTRSLKIVRKSELYADPQKMWDYIISSTIDTDFYKIIDENSSLKKETSNGIIEKFIKKLSE